MKIYISGQITGLFIEEAKKQFKEAEVLLKEKGHEVINPFNIIPDNPNPKWEDYMLADIKELFSCEAIYLLSNWYLSKGARIEKHIAEEMNFKCYIQGIDQLPN